MAVEAMVCDPALRFVCIREVQRSLKFSAKSLIESKIQELGVGHVFRVLEREIRHRHGPGVMIFEGMQDHTVESLKSLEGFGRVWIEEGQSISHRSLKILIPTIRAPGSEIWVTWNPHDPADAVDKLLRGNPRENSIVQEVNYLDNPWCPPEMLEEAAIAQEEDPDAYAHVWLGGYNTKSHAQVMHGKWRVEEFEPLPTWDGPYYGADWGFSQDPTVLVRFWVGDRCVWIEHEARGRGVDLDDTPALFDRVPGSRDHVIRADNARPETISHMQARGFRVQGAPKWSGSVEDGVAWLRGHRAVVIHPRCKGMAEEARLYSHKVDKGTGDPLPAIVDAHNHGWDAIRYGAAPMIKRSGKRVRYA